jgi:hypothetical protein
MWSPVMIWPFLKINTPHIRVAFVQNVKNVKNRPTLVWYSSYSIAAIRVRHKNYTFLNSKALGLKKMSVFQ